MFKIVREGGCESFLIPHNSKIAIAAGKGLAIKGFRCCGARYVRFDPATHFLIRMFKRVSTEMSLHVLAYNLKRVMRIIGIGPMMQAMSA
jgi:hypothetical protein